MMAETTAHEPEQPAQRWKCLACAEPWDIVQRDAAGGRRCPECGGPLRLVPSVPVTSLHLADRALVALSDDQQWLVVHWSGYRTPWTVLKRLDGIDGYTATGESYEDTGQQAGEILTAFLVEQQARRAIHLEHTAAD